MGLFSKVWVFALFLSERRVTFLMGLPDVKSPQRQKSLNIWDATGSISWFPVSTHGKGRTSFCSHLHEGRSRADLLPDIQL